jgi:hypothetical protein
MAVSAFGTPFNYPSQFSPWGISPQGGQGLGTNPYAFQQYTQNQPLLSAPLGSTMAGPQSGLQSLQQVLPLLQIVPQQLHHLQQLASVQLQELQQLQQIVQLLPVHLQQLQQLIQFVPQQLQQLQQPSPFQQSSPFQQPSQLHQTFGQSAGLGGIPVTAPWGIGPQAFGAQPSHVM